MTFPKRNTHFYSHIDLPSLRQACLDAACEPAWTSCPSSPAGDPKTAVTMPINTVRDVIETADLLHQMFK